MTAQLIALGVLVAMALLWLLINIKAASRGLKWISFVMLCTFLVCSTGAAGAIVVGALR